MNTTLRLQEYDSSSGWKLLSKLPKEKFAACNIDRIESTRLSQEGKHGNRFTVCHNHILISSSVYERDYASIGKPVIIVGGMSGYQGRDAWSKNKFVREFIIDNADHASHRQLLKEIRR